MARHPLTAVPATRSSLPLLQIRRRLVIGFLALAVVAGFFSTIAWMFGGKSTPPAPTGPDQQAIALAQTAVEDFIAARTSAVPAAQDVNDDFSKIDGTDEPRKPLDATNLTFAGAAAATLGDGVDTTPIATVQEKFTATIGGKLYELTVPMVKGAGGRWLLGADPAITPAQTAANQSSDGIDYQSLYSNSQSGGGSQLPEAYQTEIKTWAQTFAKAGHADRDLYLIVGDDSNRTYSGLGGWSLTEDPEIKSFVPVTSPYPGYIVRVGLVLRSPAANGPTLSTDYDLYLRSDKSQTQPPVVAWGAAGSYRTLMPYMNADQS